MRHKLHKYRLRAKDQRRSLMANLAISLIMHGSIETTLVKAKAIRPYVEKLITRAKTDTLANRRLIASRLYNNFEVVNRLFTVIGRSLASRPGGYTRIVRSGYRYGDGAAKAIIQIIQE